MKLLSTFIGAIMVTTAAAATFKTPEEARQHVDKAMNAVATTGLSAGLRTIKEYSVVPTAEFDAMLGQAELQFPAISQRFGRCIGTEFIREEKAGEFLRQFVYIQRFEKHAMRWAFLLYRGADGWSINTFTFDDKLVNIFQ